LTQASCDLNYRGFVTASYVHLDHFSPNTRVDLDLLLYQVLYLSPELLESIEDLILGQVSMVTFLEQEQEHLHGTSISTVICPECKESKAQHNDNS
jgi:hypothetical protein